VRRGCFEEEFVNIVLEGYVEVRESFCQAAVHHFLLFADLYFYLSLFDKEVISYTLNLTCLTWYPLVDDHFSAVVVKWENKLFTIFSFPIICGFPKTPFRPPIAV